MRELQLYFLYFDVDFVKFPHLEKLEIFVKCKDDILNEPTLMPLITSNSHIRFIKIIGTYESNIWKLISTSMKNLKYIEMSLNSSYFENKPYHFESVEELSLRVHKILGIKLADLLTFSRLKMCTFLCSSEHLELLFDFVTANSSIEKLVLNITLSSYNKKIQLHSIGLAFERYVTLNPRSIQIELCLYHSGYSSNPHDILESIKANQYISQISAWLNYESEVENLRKQITPEWKLTEERCSNSSSIHICLVRISKL